MRLLSAATRTVSWRYMTNPMSCKFSHGAVGRRMATWCSALASSQAPSVQRVERGASYAKCVGADRRAASRRDERGHREVLPTAHAWGIASLGGPSSVVTRSTNMFNFTLHVVLKLHRAKKGKNAALCSSRYRGTPRRSPAIGAFCTLLLKVLPSKDSVGAPDVRDAAA